ncbi:hypothetical protein GGX14DRAFT_574111 [Mycena pura]|uniref:Uncharacterized protein n=1 Tax=Mycena pura TaxID=153505 RepID=A0AAD6V0F6_9AGAR|nr:hypothetical protein GGX14DRAFT_581143 [Mycena pura]KAJ7197637.1 hypothetical protein GGX14DRAFT_574111 [Mycena pura]
MARTKSSARKIAGKSARQQLTMKQAVAEKAPAKKAPAKRASAKNLRNKNKQAVKIGAAGGARKEAALVGAHSYDFDHQDSSMSPTLRALFSTTNRAHGLASIEEFEHVLIQFDANTPFYVHKKLVGFYDSARRQTGSYVKKRDLVDIDYLTKTAPRILWEQGLFNDFMSLLDTWHDAVEAFPSNVAFGFFLMNAPSGNWVQEEGNEWVSRHCYGVVIRRRADKDGNVVSYKERSKAAHGNELYIFEPDVVEPAESVLRPAVRDFGVIQVIPERILHDNKTPLSVSRAFVRQIGDGMAGDGNCVSRTLEWMVYAVQNIEKLVEERNQWFWEIKDLFK